MTRTLATIATLALTVAPAHAAQYSAEAGFHPRSASITIAPELAPGATYWNALAGRALFTISGDPVITIHDPSGVCLTACTAPVGYRPDGSHGFTLTDAYDEAEIYARADASPVTLAHELGHALGFDHTRRGIMGMKPRRTTDRALLVTAGYI